MITGVLCDTGPLYAALDPDDTYHSRAQEELTRLQIEKRQTFLVYPTLFECYSLILRRLSLPAAHRWLEEVRASTPEITPTSADYLSATTLVRRYPDQTITLFDALTATMAVRLGIPIWTFDHHFDILRAPVWR